MGGFGGLEKKQKKIKKKDKKCVFMRACRMRDGRVNHIHRLFFILYTLG